MNGHFRQSQMKKKSGFLRTLSQILAIYLLSSNILLTFLIHFCILLYWQWNKSAIRDIKIFFEGGFIVMAE